MKYIDAEKLKNEIKRQADLYQDTYIDDMRDKLIDFIDACMPDIVAKEKTTEDSLQQETLKISLEKFTEKMENWKARYNYPDNIPIKATMAFTARMFDMYPDVARQWYDNLPKVTLD